MVRQQMPFGDLGVIGTFLGIDRIFNGWTYFLLGLNVRQLHA